MKKFLAIGFAMLACVFVSHAQTATSSISGSSVVTRVTDAAGNVYTTTTPLTITVTAGNPSLAIQPVPPPPPPPVNAAPTIPSNAVAVDLLKNGTWKVGVHDAGTPGTASGSNNYPVTDPVSGDSARAFSMTYTSGGGERWANSLAKDPNATHFVLDAQFSSADFTHLADLELDTNQVKADGKTAILGTQCASQEGTWDVTLNTSSTGNWHWVKTNVPCTPLTWTPNVLHHVRIFGTIDASDNSVYEGVEFDGTYTPFSGASGPTGDPLKWSAGTVLENVQFDGYKTSGSVSLYFDKLTLYRW